MTQSVVKHAATENLILKVFVQFNQLIHVDAFFVFCVLLFGLCGLSSLSWLVWAEVVVQLVQSSELVVQIIAALFESTVFDVVL